MNITVCYLQLSDQEVERETTENKSSKALGGEIEREF